MIDGHGLDCSKLFQCSYSNSDDDNDSNINTNRTKHVKLKKGTTSTCSQCNSNGSLNKLRCRSRSDSLSKSATVILGIFVSLIITLGTTTGVQANQAEGPPAVFSNQFAVHIPGGPAVADSVARKYGFVNLGQIGSLENYYLLDHPHLQKRSTDFSVDHHKSLVDEPEVHWFEQQVEKKRIKRDFAYFDTPSGAPGFYSSGGTQHSFVPKSSRDGFIDPLYKEQWYLTGGSKDGFDMNVQAAWKRGYSGKGVTVSILDDGIQTNHPDLILNYDPRASTDINGNDNDPTPQDNGDNKHGTRCAGEVAATAGNNICGVGVAFNASIGGVRMLDGTVNDAVEAKALGLNPDHIDIYSASWGPEDDGKTVDGPGPLARRAFIYGVTNGRRGLGSIFIWASGNGGRHVDSCNCDGYTNSIFTLSISSATQGGYKPWYLEECASTLATTYSSGTPTLDKSVATVDMDGRLRPDHICTVEHTGTSASAPLAAGIAALALEANRNLSWRDMQHLVVLSSRSQPLEKEEGWFINGVKRKFSHKFGYGLMDAGAIVDLAKTWAGVPPQHICKSREIREDREIPGAHLGKVKVFMDVDGCAGSNSEIKYLEHVQCKISLRFFPRGNLRIQLTSPMGTTSVLLFERPRDVSSSNFDDWPFLSVHFWGEQAHGRWTLEIINSGSRRINQPGILKKWQLILYGTDINPARVKSRSYPIHNQPQRFEAPVAQSQPIYRHAQPIVPRYHAPDEFIYPGASENVPQYSRQQAVRSQCQNDFWVPDLSICVNACPEPGYFAVDDSSRKECLSCSPRCKSCNNSTSCQACEHNLVLFGTTCVSVCPQGFFSSDSSCEVCQLDNCATCGGPMGTECLKCKEDRVLYQNQCIEQCPEGFRATIFNECVPCPLGCQACDEFKCLQCANGFKLNNEKNSCVLTSHDCPFGLYLDSETQQCMGCGSEDCKQCAGLNACAECRNDLLVVNGDCAKNCGEGLYMMSNSKECLNCPILCKQCESPELCLECREDAILQDGRCLSYCSQGYFNDAGTCTKCSKGCKTCIGQGISDCVSCDDGYNYTRTGVCVSHSNFILKEPQQSTEISCSDGYWLNQIDNTCRPCHKSCSKCTGGNPYNCRSCVAPLRLDRGSSRCIACCQGSNNEDCCHCETKRHTETLLTKGYNGECHFVSRRVSESVETELSSGKWRDSSVLSFFWLSMFIVIVGLVVALHRRRKNTRGSLSKDCSDSSAFSKTFDKSFYTQMSNSVCDNDMDNSEPTPPNSLHEMSLEDYSEDDETINFNETKIKSSEIRPLVLNT